MHRPWAAVLLGAWVTVAPGCNLKQYFDDPRCLSTADCFGSDVCAANVCIPIGSLGTGRRCWATRDCKDGQSCQLLPIDQGDGTTILDQRCAPAGSGDVGAACTSAAGCIAGLRCALVGFGGTCQMGGTRDRGGACSSTGECLAGLACAPDGTCEPYTDAYPPFAGVACPAETGAFRAHVEVPRPGAPLPDFLRLPFPSDVRVDAGGHLDLSDFPRGGPTPLGVDLVQLYVDALVADFDGFSAVAPVTFRFSGPVDAGSLDGAATLVDLGDGTELPARATSHPERTKYSCPDRVVVEHAVGDVLLPRHQYAVVLRGVTGGGVAASPDADLTALLGETRPADAALGRAWDQHAPLRAWLANKGIAAADVQAATVFTVGDAVRTMGRIKTAVGGAPAPVLSDLTLCGPGVTSPRADGGADRVCGTGDPAYDEIQGRITLPIFQQGTAPYLTPADGGGIDADAPQVVRTEPVCFALTVPRGTAPAGGWPLAIYAHGTGGSFRSFITEEVGPILATSTVRYATLSFDGVEHGARKNGSSEPSDHLVFNVLNPRAARDNVLQSGADLLQLFRMGGVTVPASATGAAITFDPAHVVFFGHSQGANAGHLGLAYADDGRAAVLSGSGGGVIDGLLSKTSPIDIGAGLRFLLGEPLDATHPAMIVFQTFFDRSDPLVYAPLLIRRTPAGVPSKNVLHTYGVGDTYAPPRTLANVTEGLGVPLSTPVLEPIDDPVSGKVPVETRPIIADLVGADGSTITAATFQYTPASGEDGHFVALRDRQAITDWTFFFTSFVLAGTPHVP